MQDSQELRDVILNAGIDPLLIMDKTKEFLRLLQMKLPAGCLQKAEACRHIIAIELACRVENVPFEKSRLLRLSSVNTNEYKRSLNTCKTVLNLTWNAVAIFHVLAIQYGDDLKDIAQNILTEYKLSQSNSGKFRTINLDVTSSLYQSAAFFLAAKRKKVLGPNSIVDNNGFF